MDARLKAIAERCKDGAESNRMTFPEVVGALIKAGFEGYMVDYRRGAATYFLADGDHVEFRIHEIHSPVGAAFNAEEVQRAIRDAQALVEGYTYLAFCERVKAAGCAGYIVSFSGKRAVYFGRTAETHIEYFPGSR